MNGRTYPGPQVDTRERHPGPLGTSAPPDAASAPAHGWDEYLTALEHAVLAVDTAVLKSGVPGWTVAAQPDGPMPARLRIRAQVLLALVHDVTVRAQFHHDHLAADLAAMPPPRPIDHAHAAFLGGNLDVLT